MINHDLIEKWKTLMSTLEVAEKSNLICSPEDVEKAQDNLGFKFPIGYKEYSLVFGSGSLGYGDAPDFFRVYCPCCPPSSFDIRETGHNLIGLQLDIEAAEPIEDERKAEIIYRLLENGYAFADTSSADSFFWDLTTYRENDQSYDIYWIPDEDVESITFIGRDFFEFIEKFCLETGLQKMYSEQNFHTELDSHQRFFSAFENYDENLNCKPFTQHLFENVGNFINRESFSEKAVVKFKCSYDARNKEQADCLQRLWKDRSGIEIKVVAPSERPFIPRLVEVSITKGSVSHETVEKILQEAIQIGDKCGCSVNSFGTEINFDE